MHFNSANSTYAPGGPEEEEEEEEEDHDEEVKEERTDRIKIRG